MARTELLAPAGNLEKLHTALLYGADAVYLGGRSHNLRAGSDGFSGSDLAEGLKIAKEHEARVYYCLNSLPFEGELAGLPGLIEETAQAGVHAFIVADPGIFRLVRTHAPGVPIHLSTQANTTNSQSIAFWQDMGVARVNLARELTCRDIYSLRRAAPDMELEVFAHGAMCLAVSGQCLLSAWLNNRPANQGRCTHPCRFTYRGKEWSSPSLAAGGEEGFFPQYTGPGAALAVEEAMRAGQSLWEVTQSEPYSSIWAPQDLCLVHYLPWFIRTGVDSLKIEGRMKSSAYVALTVDAYHTALAHARESVYGPGGIEEGLNRGTFQPGRYVQELLHTASRPLGTGFFLPWRRRNITEETQASNVFFSPRPVLARVLERAGEAAWHVEVRARWQTDKAVELVLPGLRRPVVAAREYSLENHRGERSAVAGSGIRGVLHAEQPDIVPGVFIREAEAPA